MRESSPEQMTVKALPTVVSEAILRHNAEKRRLKKGILAESEERIVFAKNLYLPYLDFTYQYSTEKGFPSKQTVLSQGRSVVMALREVDFGFEPDLAKLASQISDLEFNSNSIIQGVDSTVLVGERLEELKRTLSDYDNQLLELARQYDSLAKANHARQDVKENIDHLKESREMRWKMFADGLKLPSRIDLETLELLQGNLFYVPYFIVRFSQRGESRFLVWDRVGKESDVIVDELAKNAKFRDLIQSHALAGNADGSKDPATA